MSGTAGVGKTRLAREVLAVASADGAQTEWVQATAAAASIPFGALFGLVPPGARTDNRLQLFQLCADALRERASSGRVVLGVDDAHLLDSTSAAFVLHLTMSKTVFVVVTVRSGERCPDSIAALWKDLGTPRLELQQLSVDETGQLLEAVLGGIVAPGVRRWAYKASEGHALYLRELVNGALAAGALTKDDGTWRLRSDPGASPALVDLISRSLEDLTGGELDTVRLLAIGEPLELEVVGEVVGLEPLAALEEKGLAHVSAGAAPRATTEVRLSHPLYGEVVRATMPTLRGRELRQRLAATVRTRGLEHPGEALRVATWLEGAGAELDDALLMAAARDAIAAGDADLAERLVSRAPTGVEQALVLAAANALRNRFAEAEAILAPWEGTIADKKLAASYLQERAHRVLRIGLQRSNAALALVGRARHWFPDEDWGESVELVRVLVAVWRFDGAAQALLDLASLERLARDDSLTAGDRRRAMIEYALTLGKLGRFDEMRDVATTLRTSVPLRDDDDVWTVFVWWWAHQDGGYEWDEMERWLLEAEQATAAADDPRSRGEIVTALACSALRRGKPTTAAAWAREAIETFDRFDPFGRLPFPWLMLTLSAVMRADAEAARKALAGYEAAAGERSEFDVFETRVRASLAVLEGESGIAVDMLLELVATRSLTPVTRALTLHEALRSGADPGAVASEFEAPEARCDGPLVALIRQFAAAMAAGDAAALHATAEGFGEMGAWLWAAESAALAARSYEQAGRQDSARRAMALSGRFLEECEDVSSPVLAAVALAPAELTRREQEIVQLAARGVSNAEIGERLHLSRRTVESHLYRAMRKLGVNTRHELRAD